MITRNDAEARIAAGGTLSRSELSEVLLAPGDMTASDMERFSLACPEWLEEDSQRQEQHRELKERSREDQALILTDLRGVGYNLETVWNLVNTAESYPDAIPVLLDHIRLPYAAVYREGMARALTVREARGVAGPTMVALLRDRASLGLFQDADDLLFRKLLPLHQSVPSWGRSLGPGG